MLLPELPHFLLRLRSLPLQVHLVPSLEERLLLALLGVGIGGWLRRCALLKSLSVAAKLGSFPLGLLGPLPQRLDAGLGAGGRGGCRLFLGLGLRWLFALRGLGLRLFALYGLFVFNRKIEVFAVL